MKNEYPKRKTVRLREYDYDCPGVYFLTICTQDKKCILSHIVGTGVLDGPQIALTPYGVIADKYIRQLNDFYGDLNVNSYVIMPNHIHMLLELKEDAKLETQADGPSGTPVPTAQNSRVSRFVSTFKRFCNKEFGKNIWQARSYDHVIRDQQDYDEHLKYIFENPCRWQEDQLFVKA